MSDPVECPPKQKDCADVNRPRAPLRSRSALVVAVEISQAAWVIAAHVPGLGHVKVKRRIEPHGEALLLAIRQLKRRASIAPEHVVVTYETGYSGFWVARLLQQHATEVSVI